ncbi:hypothetical protein D3C75_538530 [compost metagenome]
MPPRCMRIIVIRSNNIPPRVSVHPGSTVQKFQYTLNDRVAVVLKMNLQQLLHRCARLNRRRMRIPGIRLQGMSKPAVLILVSSQRFQYSRQITLFKMIFPSRQIQRTGVAVNPVFDDLIIFGCELLHQHSPFSSYWLHKHPPYTCIKPDCPQKSCDVLHFPEETFTGYWKTEIKEAITIFLRRTCYE